MTGRENVEMVARLFGVPRARLVPTPPTSSSTSASPMPPTARSTYSGGMRRRLDLGASLVGKPRLLLLDEPTTGLDPRSRLEFWDLIRSLVADGTDVLLSTQYLDEADHLASHVAIIDHGRVVASGTPRDLKQRAGRSIVEVHVRDVSVPRPRRIHARVHRRRCAHGRRGNAQRPCTARVGTAQLFAALRPLDEAGISLEEVSVRQPTLDEAFLALTNTSRRHVA